jgi:hypothetical protein
MAHFTLLSLKPFRVLSRLNEICCASDLNTLKRKKNSMADCFTNKKNIEKDNHKTLLRLKPQMLFHSGSSNFY